MRCQPKLFAEPGWTGGGYRSQLTWALAGLPRHNAGKAPTMKKPTPKKIGQTIFREWCARFGATVEVHMASDLVARIAKAIEAERAKPSN
jgi:hypothetical protein